MEICPIRKTDQKYIIADIFYRFRVAFSLADGETTSNKQIEAIHKNGVIYSIISVF